MKLHQFLACLVTLMLTGCGLLTPGALPTSAPVAPSQAQVAASATALHLTALAPIATTAPPTQSPTVTAPPVETATTAAPTSALVVVASPTGPACVGRPDWPVYTVQAGDTLTRLAAETGVTVEVLMQANCLADTRILVGQRLFVPTLPATSVAPLTATPSPTDTPGPPLAILSFTVSPQEVVPGDSVTVTWNTTGYATTLGQAVAAGVGPFSFLFQPPSGSRVVPFYGLHWNDFTLYTYGDNGAVLTSTITVRQRCPAPFFFQTSTRLCPSGPALDVSAVEQDFENGSMLWLEHLPDGVLSGPVMDKLIFIFYSNHDLARYADPWNSSLPETDPALTPPAGLYSPLRGFGLLWRDQPGVQSRLGWAVAPVHKFDTLYQEAVGLESDNGCAYLQLADGRAVGLCRRSMGWTTPAP